MRPPGYWIDESSGVLRPAVEAYLRGKTLTAPQIAAMRAYLRQWVMADGWDANPHATDESRAKLAELRRRVDQLTTTLAIEDWLADATDFGMDPL